MGRKDSAGHRPRWGLPCVPSGGFLPELRRAQGRPRGRLRWADASLPCSFPPLLCASGAWLCSVLSFVKHGAQAGGTDPERQDVCWASSGLHLPDGGGFSRP